MGRGLLRRIGNAAAVGFAPVTGGLSLLGKKDVRDAVGSIASDPVGAAKGAYEWASGAQDTQKAFEQQQAGVAQASGAITDAYNQGRGFLSPYQQAGAQNFQDFSGMVKGGAFNPQMQQYGGLMSSGGAFNPQFQGYGGPMSSGNNLPQFQGYQGPMSSGNQAPKYEGFNAGTYQAPEAFKGSNATTDNLGAYGLKGFDPSMPQAPTRQAATTENVNMFNDPGYKFRLEQGLNAVQSSAAAKGLLGSSGTLNQIQDYAQGLASQEYDKSYGRFQDGQNNGMSDFRDTRNFAANQLNDSYNRFSGDRGFGRETYTDDRNFGRSNFESDRGSAQNQNQFQNNFSMQGANFNQGAFEGDRAAGMQANQFQNNWAGQNFDRGQSAFEGDRAAGINQNQFANNWGMNNANFQQGAFEGDRTAGMQGNQFQNNFNMQNSQNKYNQWNGLVGMGYDANLQGANMATGYGANMAGLFGDSANAQAQATMTKSQQNRGLFRDIVNAGARAYGGG